MLYAFEYLVLTIALKKSIQPLLSTQNNTMFYSIRFSVKSST